MGVTQSSSSSSSNGTNGNAAATPPVAPRRVSTGISSSCQSPSSPPVPTLPMGPHETVKRKILAVKPELGTLENAPELSRTISQRIVAGEIYPFFQHLVNPQMAKNHGRTPAEIRSLEQYLAGTSGFLPIKLVLSSLKLNESTLQFALAKMMVKSPKYGFAHVDFIVGDRVVGWTENALVDIHPIDKCQHLRRAVMVIDLHVGIKASEAGPWLRAFCGHIADWNGGFEYHLTRSNYDDVKMTQAGNCHGFFEYIVSQPEMKIDRRYISGAARTLIDLFIEHPLSWHKHVKLRGKRVPLKSHAEFDEFVVREYQDKDVLANDYDILKALDRAQWMRYQANQSFIAEQLAMEQPDMKKIGKAQAQVTRYESCCISSDGGLSYRRACPFGSPLPHEERIPELIPFGDVLFAVTPGYEKIVVHRPDQPAAAASSSPSSPATAPVTDHNGAIVVDIDSDDDDDDFDDVDLGDVSSPPAAINDSGSTASCRHQPSPPVPSTRR